MSFLQILSVLVVFSASVYCNPDVSILQKLEALDNRMKSMEAKLKNCETDFEGIKPFIQGLATDLTELSTNFNETTFAELRQELMNYASENLIKINAFLDSPYLSKYLTDEVNRIMSCLFLTPFLEHCVHFFNH